MAFLTGHDGVAPDQREPRKVVIERDDAAPIRLTVALLAAAAELTLVRVVLAVAGHAGRRQLVTVEIARVAAIAPHLGVRSTQWIFCRLVVIEVDRAPLVLVVAAVAFRAVPPAMNILNPVAIHACGADILVPFAHMARRTGHRRMRALEPEFRLFVVESLDPTPHCLEVAIVARLPKTPFVRIARFMTIEAAPPGGGIFRGLRMTVAARYRCVRVPEREIRKPVIEGLWIKQENVGISSLMIRVAMVAFLRQRLWITPMEGRAHLALGACVLMTCEAELALRCWREGCVAIVALLLELGVPGHERPERDKFLEHALGSPC